MLGFGANIYRSNTRSKKQNVPGQVFAPMVPSPNSVFCPKIWTVVQANSMVPSSGFSFEELHWDKGAMGAMMMVDNE